jgi:hypothetical protein
MFKLAQGSVGVAAGRNQAGASVSHRSAPKLGVAKASAKPNAVSKNFLAAPAPAISRKPSAVTASEGSDDWESF